MAEKYWEHFEHEADIGVRGVAATLAEAFEQAALAMLAVITDPKLVVADNIVEVECVAPDNEILFVDWLNSIVYEIATRKMLFSEFEVAIEGLKLRGKLYGEKLDMTRHHPAVEIKGATYTALKVGQVDNNWLAECVVDV